VQPLAIPALSDDRDDGCQDFEAQFESNDDVKDLSQVSRWRST
jgi:hypothetical protein